MSVEVNIEQAILDLERSWRTDKRWTGIVRPYKASDVIRLRGSINIEYTLSRLGAERLWYMLQTEPFIRTLGALTGNQAVQMVQAGLKSIYASGWQVAADQNDAHQTYPDQSLYPVTSVPSLVKRFNQALQRADQISFQECRLESCPYWYAPIVADGEAGFGGVLNTYELTKAMIEAGAAGVHYEDQLSSAKKCGHMGGKVLVPTREAVSKLIAARLAADVMGVPLIIIGRTDANGATLLTSDIDERDKPYLTGKRVYEGFYEVKSGLDAAIARGLAYAPYADLVWCETAHPDLQEAKEFAEGVHRQFPGKLMAYNCSPSFNWRLLDDATIAKFQRELAAMGYKYQFITLAGFHTVNYMTFELAHSYRDEGMAAYLRLQEAEFELEKTHGFRAVKHQSFVGAGYFDDVNQVIMGGQTSTLAMKGSTEMEQFKETTPDFIDVEIHHMGAAELEKMPPPPQLIPGKK